jgi:vacuolar-type H+-ATPase subunit H
MAKAPEMESTLSETESIIAEYWDKIKQAMENENVRLREKAESESDQILSSARDEADVILLGARDEAEKLVKKTREEAAAARQETARLISEAREKASKVISEIIERGTAQAQNEFARAAADARSKTSLLLTQVSKTLEQIVAEAEGSIKAELERCTLIMVEAESNLQPLSQIPAPPKEIEPEPDPLSREAPRAKSLANDKPVSEKKEPAPPLAPEKKPSQGKNGEDDRLFKGRLKLEIASPYEKKTLEAVPGWLARIPGLRIISKGGYVGPNMWNAYSVELEQPMPLLKILVESAPLEDAVERNGIIILRLK